MSLITAFIRSSYEVSWTFTDRLNTYQMYTWAFDPISLPVLCKEPYKAHMLLYRVVTQDLTEDVTEQDIQCLSTIRQRTWCCWNKLCIKQALDWKSHDHGLPRTLQSSDSRHATGLSMHTHRNCCWRYPNAAIKCLVSYTGWMTDCCITEWDMEVRWIEPVVEDFWERGMWYSGLWRPEVV
jgi:hypothetical protein